MLLAEYPLSFGGMVPHLFTDLFGIGGFRGWLRFGWIGCKLLQFAVFGSGLVRLCCLASAHVAHLQDMFLVVGWETELDMSSLDHGGS